jgi:hypothetical protein
MKSLPLKLPIINTNKQEFILFGQAKVAKKLTRNDKELTSSDTLYLPKQETKSIALKS